jgi:hypothetical protein
METKKERKPLTFKHGEYVNALADRIIKLHPAKETLVKTLTDFAMDMIDEGYQMRITHAKNFKDKREWHRKNSFDKVRDNFDNIIHSKSNQPK